MNPVLLMIAGPNGAGKTTVTARLREERWSEGVEYINPDEVANDRFGGWNSPDAVLRAAQWCQERRDYLLSQDQGIAFETVFSAPDKVEFLLRAYEAGYFVRVFFIGTSDPAINAARVARRMSQGGHSVPIEKIVSRYERSMTNLRAAIRLADRTYVYDNSIDDVDASLCVRTEGGELRKIYRAFPQWVANAVGALPRHPDFIDVTTTT